MAASRPRNLAVLAIVLVVLGLAVGARVIAHPSTSSPGPTTTTSGRTATSSSGTSSTSDTQRRTTSPLTVISIVPASGASGVQGMTPITIKFSSPVTTDSVLPTVDPSATGSWVRRGTELTFTPTTAFIPLSQVTVSIPAGIAATNGATLSAPTAASFVIGDGSVLRLQQLFSQLDYSPLSWEATGAAIDPSDVVGERASLFNPPTGTFTWRKMTWPSQLLALWAEGRYNVMTRGLVMSFQADHGLNVTGEPTAGLWQDLLSVLVAGEHNTGGYNFALADQAQPESLTIWHNGKTVLHVPANTGIAAAPTPDGVFPVFARYRDQIMRGRNPDGTTYADPVQYVAYFHSGDAVHYLPRASYGIPQSLGCVELSLIDAASAWPWLAYGTPVDIIN